MPALRAIGGCHHPISTARGDRSAPTTTARSTSADDLAPGPRCGRMLTRLPYGHSASRRNAKAAGGAAAYAVSDTMAPAQIRANGVAVAPPPFVGRHRELELLERCLADALAGTSAVRAAGRRGGHRQVAPAEGAPRARAIATACRCFMAAAPRTCRCPTCPFVEALEGPCGRRSAQTPRPCAGSCRRGPAPSPARRPDAQSSAPSSCVLFRAVSRACVALAQRHPTLLVLEDLHWADRSTLDLLQHVVFTVADAAMREPVPLLIVVTYRSAEADERLGRTVARLRREDIAVDARRPGARRGGDRRADPPPRTRPSRRTSWCTTVNATRAATRSSSRSCCTTWSSAARSAAAAAISPPSATSAPCACPTS